MGTAEKVAAVFLLEAAASAKVNSRVESFGAYIQTLELDSVVCPIMGPENKGESCAKAFVVVIANARIVGQTPWIRFKL